MSVVAARGLTKCYGDFCAVDKIDLDIAAGECFGMLGPNGAGKTTTLRMIGCVIGLTEGTLRVLDMDVRARQREIKARLGVVPQANNLDDELTVEENLVVYAGYFGIKKRTARRRSQELLDFMTLRDRAGRKVRELSDGMKRRLVIARSLVNEPEVLLLDEPTTGLDPQARHLIWERLRLLKERGSTLVLTTHYMDEAAHLCDRLVIMNHARVLVLGTPKELIRQEIPRHVVEVPLRLATDRDAVQALGDDSQVLADRVLLHTNNGAEVIRGLTAMGIDESELVERMASLEDVFLRLTGRVAER